MNLSEEIKLNKLLFLSDRLIIVFRSVNRKSFPLESRTNFFQIHVQAVYFAEKSLAAADFYI